MRAEVARIGENRVEIEVEMDPQQLDQALDRAYRKLVQQVNVPGFRKGKAPRSVLERQVGPEVLRQEAAQALAGEGFEWAVRERKLEPVGQPEVETVQLEPGKPFVFKARVDVKPEAQVAHYEGLPVKKPRVEVKPEEIDALVERTRQDLAVLEVADHDTAQPGDFAEIDYAGFLDGKPFAGGAGKGSLLQLGSGRMVAGFEEQIVGMKTGEEKTFTVKFPEDYGRKELAGKDVTFRVTLRELKTRRVPEADDELAKQVGPYSTLAELRAEYEKQLRARKERAARKYVESQVLEQLRGQIQDLAIPEAMILERMHTEWAELERDLARQGLSVEQYEAITRQSQEDLLKSIRNSSEIWVRNRLALEAVARQANIQVDDTELEEKAKPLEEALARGRQQDSQTQPDGAAAEPGEARTRRHSHRGKAHRRGTGRSGERQAEGQAPVLDRERLRNELRLSKALDYVVDRADVQEVDPAELASAQPAAEKAEESQAAVEK
ncbi:MAG: trigger factor [Firmicutes bacterium]|nr:trigger factor [Bacillota bacterium]